MPSFTRSEFTNAKSIINVMPVTRSGFTMGSCETFSTRLRERFFIELIPMAAAVPTSVASTLDTTATRSVRRSGSTESPVKSRR